MLGRHRHLFVTALLMLLAAPATAAAGTLSKEGNTVRYVANPGEVNQFRVTQFSADIGFGDGTASFQDVSGITAVGPDCFEETVGSSTYWHCRNLAADAKLVLDLGDRSDNNAIDKSPFSRIEVDGGSGDDVLAGAYGADLLRGGEGDDRLTGDEYYISLTNSNSFSVHSGDEFFGGPGSDLVSYYYHQPVSRVTATIDDVADDGDPDERDNVHADVEGLEAPLYGTGAFTGGAADDGLYGSSGADVLIGLGGNDKLQGFDGNDMLEAGAGDDFLEGGADDDQLDGGAGLDSFAGDFSGNTQQVVQGNDRIKAADGVAEDISCGPGADTVDADPIDRVVTDGQNLCETINKVSGIPAPGPGGPGPTNGAAVSATKKQKLKTVLAKGIALKATCPAVCRIKATASIKKATARRLKVGKAIGKGTKTLLAAGQAKVSVKLTAKAKRRLRRVRSLPVTLSVVLTDAAKATTRFTARVTVTR